MSSASTKIIQAAAGNAGEALYVEDVFSTYLYTGNGSTQTITNGIDLAGEGGLVWIKNRGAGGHLLSDSARSSIGNYLVTNSTNAEANPGNFINSYNSNGFTLGTWVANTSGDNYVSWTFRKAPKFFDVVTFTADAGSNNGTKAHAHNLGSSPGFIIIKQTNAANSWVTFHRSLAANNLMFLNATSDVSINSGYYSSVSDTHVTVGNALNENSAEYVMYLFAHNNNDGDFGETGDQDIIKCGSYTGNGSADGPEIDLGFEPQWVLIKETSGTGDWYLVDNMRGLATGGNDSILYPNGSSAEATAYNIVDLQSNGFKVTYAGGAVNTNSDNYIYIAIRRGPMKTPESGTEVFALQEDDAGDSSAPAFRSGFPVDAAFSTNAAATSVRFFGSRLQGANYLRTSETNAEAANADFEWDYMNGWNSEPAQGPAVISYMFRRAPGFFDVVAYEGDDASDRAVTHNLNVAPEMYIIKERGETNDWWVYHKDLTDHSYYLRLNLSNAQATSTGVFGGNAPTSTAFYVDDTGNTGTTNNGSNNYIAYLFASLPGISKVGSYTGNGTSQTIDCGFSAGARFVLIKRTDASGNWKVMDTARGIVAGDDKVLELDNTSAESTFDLIDPDSSGFAVEGNTTQGQNQSGATYIFLAIA